jgi:glycosyltransferase involved in cell wall biosynthesis
MGGGPAVSVLIPVYNVSKYLHQCMDSVVGQTLKNIEIICINDGSTDDSLDILKSYASKDSRIKIIDKKNTGYGNSMNIAMDNATGDYIGIVESDDFAESDMFEKLYKEAVKDDLDVSRCNFYYHTAETGKDVKSDLRWVKHNEVYSPDEEWGVFYQQPSVWANLYKTSFLRENNIRFLETPGASYQDTAFTFKVYSLAKRFKIIPDALIHYRVDSSDSSCNTATTKVYCVCDEYNEIKRFTKENGTYEKYRKLIVHLQYNGYEWNYKRLAEPYNQEFLKRWREEFTEEYNKGNIDRNIFSPEEYENVLSIILKGKHFKDNKGPSVSIIIPVYNMKDYLRECMDSVVNQTYKDIEIICVNDGSTDNSLSILEEYASGDDRIKIINKPNGGLSSARNAGIKSASGKFIIFLDSDDYIETDTVECAMSKIDGVDIVIYGTDVFGDAMMERRADDEEYYKIKFSGYVQLDDNIRNNTDVSAWNKVYRKSIIDRYELSFPEGMLFEDYSFYWRYIFCCKSAYYIQEKKHHYRRREGSIMNQTFEGSPRAIEHLYAVDFIFDFILKNGMKNKYFENLVPIFLNCFWFAYGNSNSKNKKRVLKKSTAMLRKMELSGDYVIDNLRNGTYFNIDGIDPPLYQKAFGRLYSKFTELFGIQGSSNVAWKSLSAGSPFDYSDYVATTKWVQNHEWSAGVDRWKTTFDSSKSWIDWGYPGGIPGGKEIYFENFHSLISPGHRFRFFVSFRNMNPMILSGEVNNNEKFTWAGTLYIDNSLVCLSVVIELKEKKLFLKGIDVTNSIDFSTECTLTKIQMTV